MHKRSLLILLIVSLLSVLTGMLHEEEQLQEETTAPVCYNIVPYELTFRRLAPDIGWEWHLLAAVAYHESRFNEHAHSPYGAKGIMQLMDRTARRFGLTDSTIWVAEDNIAAGVRYIAYLQSKFDFISNPEEQTKFVLASYNIGPSGIFAARHGAEAAGRNPYRWSDVEPYVQSSYARAYVRRVLRTARSYSEEEERLCASNNTTNNTDS